MADTTTKTFWLSFCDGARPAGKQFLGVCVVDVTSEDAEAADMLSPSGDRWVCAACQTAWRMACNPGGQMMSVELMSDHENIPRNRLMQQSELAALGLIPAA